MLELQDISVVFHPKTIDEKVALSHINFRIEDGDFVTIIGSNGAGKSTLFQTISGAVPLITDISFLISRTSLH